MDGSAGRVVRIYRVCDERSQTLIAALLSGMANLNVHVRGGAAHHYVLVEISAVAQASSVERFVRLIDPDAALVHTTNESMHAIPA